MKKTEYALNIMRIVCRNSLLRRTAALLLTVVLFLLLSPFLLIMALIVIQFYDYNVELLNRLSALCDIHWAGLPHLWNLCVPEEGVLGWCQIIELDVLLLLVLWLGKSEEPKNRFLKFVKRWMLVYTAEH